MAIVIIISICIAAVAFAYAFYCRIREKKTLSNITCMLDEAIQGVFLEQHYDESLLSSIETKLAHYLSASLVSEKNLKEEKEKIKTFISDISHQTKTPLSNIILYTQLLKTHELSSESKLCVETLEKQGNKLQMLIETLVKMSRLETGIIALNVNVARISPMLNRAVESFRSKADEKKIALLWSETDDVAVFDPKWTEEAVCNLLDNAIKYTPQGGRIEIVVKKYELYCCIDIKDNGTGISEEKQAKIFNRFYRADSSMYNEGVGIGLFIVRQIAACQGGYIKVKSKKGEGSTFSLFLPNTLST